MITLSNIKKVFRTEEIDTWALREVSLEVKDGEDGVRRLAGFNLVCDHDEEGSVAYDTGAMLTLRIEAAYRM